MLALPLIIVPAYVIVPWSTSTLAKSDSLNALKANLI